MVIRPVKGAVRWILCILLIVSVAAAAYFSVRYIRFGFETHTAMDFGFEDIKSPLDADGDGVDDYSDMVAGARAYIATKPIYESRYYSGGYPDDGKGVCTDVIWHAFDAAGYCLKDMVDADIAANREEYEKYGGVGDKNIDFRRVRNLLVFFGRHAQSLTTSKERPSDWMPGDIVIFDGHIAICSDVRNPKGMPYIIHHGNLHDGAVEADEMGRFEIVGHFRYTGI